MEEKKINISNIYKEYQKSGTKLDKEKEKEKEKEMLNAIANGNYTLNDGITLKRFLEELFCVMRTRREHGWFGNKIKRSVFRDVFDANVKNFTPDVKSILDYKNWKESSVLGQVRRDEICSALKKEEREEEEEKNKKE